MVRGIFISTLALMLTTIPAWAIFESDNTLADQAKVSMTEAIHVAQQTIPGKPVHVKMGKDLGYTVYQVEIMDKDSKSRWVYLDAANGALTEVKRSSFPSLP
jgi:uncharacterized membrane protein YkoI